MQDSQRLVDKIVEIVESKKAKNICVINIHDISILSDFFVICSGASTANIKAIIDELEKVLGEQAIKCLHKEGYDGARWVLLDYGNVIVHVFHPEVRELYGIERIWDNGNVRYINNSEE